MKYLSVYSIPACLKLSHKHECTIDGLLPIEVFLYLKTVCFSKHSLPTSAFQNSYCIISGKVACFVPRATHELCFWALQLLTPWLLPPDGYLPQPRPAHSWWTVLASCPTSPKWLRQVRSITFLLRNRKAASYHWGQRLEALQRVAKKLSSFDEPCARGSQETMTEQRGEWNRADRPTEVAKRAGPWDLCGSFCFSRCSPTSSSSRHMPEL